MDFSLRMEDDYDLNGKVLVIEHSYGRLYMTLENFLARFPRGFCRVIKSISWQPNTSAIYQLQLFFCTTVMPFEDLFAILDNYYPYVHEARELRIHNANDRHKLFTYYELISCLAADQVIFDSHTIMMKFIGKLGRCVENDKEFWPSGFNQILRLKSKVVYCPLDGHMLTQFPKMSWKNQRKELLIIWPHCWEFDRNPLSFFKIIQRLETEGFKFKIRVLEEQFCKKPAEFQIQAEKCATRLFDFGFINRSTDKMYYTMLKQADVVLTTSINEFFGVTVMEAVYSGCVPVIPKSWSYKELYAKQVKEMYQNDEEIYDILTHLCRLKMAGALHHDYRQLVAAHSAEGWFRNMIRNISRIRKP